MLIKPLKSKEQGLIPQNRARGLVPRFLLGYLLFCIFANLSQALYKIGAFGFAFANWRAESQISGVLIIKEATSFVFSFFHSDILSQPICQQIDTAHHGRVRLILVQIPFLFSLIALYSYHFCKR